MSAVTEFFDALWAQYLKVTPQAQAIHTLLADRGETPRNDHVAFRTFDDCPIDMEHLVPVLESLGYQFDQHYDFSAKKLIAASFSCPGQPKIFLSELKRGELSETAQRLLAPMIEQITDTALRPEVFYAGRLWDLPSFATYETLADESEYAGWLSVWGLRANHFTVDLNALDSSPSVQEMNRWIKAAGYEINQSGGEVKGTPDDLLEQSSTLADQVEIEFAEGTRPIPSCFYEFARRHPDAEGNLYQGFVAANANKIFESTHRQ